MDQNKIPDNNANNSELNGFDSATRGYTVTPEGGFFESGRPEAKTVAPLQPTEEDTQKVVPETADFSTSDSEEEPAPSNEPSLTESAPQYTPYQNVYYRPQKPQRPKKKYGLGVVVLCVLLAAVIGAGSGIGAVLMLQKNSQITAPADDAEGNEIINTTINVDKTASSVIEAVAEKASASVVGIRTTVAMTNFFGGSEDTTGEGSGIIYSSDGYIITNYHVLKSALSSPGNTQIAVYLNEDTSVSYTATAVGYNIRNDLAVLKIDAKNLPAIEMGDSDSLKKGQFVAAIGCPGGLNFIGSVSYGIISGLNRTVSGVNKGSVSLIQTDAAINPGNSGGALLDTSGKLIGVNSSKIASTEYEGMGFAIPVNTVVEICDQIIAKKDDPEPYIGISVSETYDERVLTMLGYPAGAVVTSVSTDSPAYESGIHRGDIITEFGSNEISSYNDYYTAVSECSAGDSISIKIYRSGRYYSTKITVAANN